MPYKDPEKRREYRRKRYAESREKELERRRKWSDENREKERERKRKWHEENRENVLKRKRKHREENIERERERERKYYEKNREKVLRRQRKYREENSEKVREYQRKYREENHEKKREYHRKWREENREKVLKRKRKYREENHEKVRECQRKWREENPEKVRESARACSRRRRARRKGATVPGHRVTGKHETQIKMRFGWSCACCGNVLDQREKASPMDHFVPLAGGGKDAAWNLIPLCWTCNSSKGASDPLEWLRRKRYVRAFTRRLIDSGHWIDHPHFRHINAPKVGSAE